MRDDESSPVKVYEEDDVLDIVNGILDNILRPVKLPMKLIGLGITGNVDFSWEGDYRWEVMRDGSIELIADVIATVIL